MVQFFIFFSLKKSHMTWDSNFLLLKQYLLYQSGVITLLQRLIISYMFRF